MAAVAIRLLRRVQWSKYLVLKSWKNRAPLYFLYKIEAEGKTYRPPSFYWKLNAGRIVKGQYGREIEVTTTGANDFEKITATVEIGGFDPSCFMTGSCSTKIIGNFNPLN